MDLRSADCAGGRKAEAIEVVGAVGDRAVEEISHAVGVIGARRAKPTIGGGVRTQAAIHKRRPHVVVELCLFTETID